MFLNYLRITLRTFFRNRTAFIINLLGILLLITGAMILDIMLVWVERKVVARFQGRLGPNRVGPFGLFQPFPDIIKLIIKEDITPDGADKLVYNIAPILSLGSSPFEEEITNKPQNNCQDTYLLSA